MRAGRLDRLITIQRKTVTQSPSGEPVETWATIADRRAAGIWSPQQGSETFSDPQLVARERVEWLVRYSANLADLTPLDRVIYPALAGCSTDDVPAGAHVYDVVSVHEVGRREGLRIVTARRPDLTP